MVKEITLKENSMIKLENRLAEREVKRVLQKWTPFFSYNLVVNQIKNNKEFNRFAIVIWSKSVKLAVHRNFLRRRFYDYMKEFIDDGLWRDIVFVIKKKSSINIKDKASLDSFYKDIKFLSKKIFK